MATGSADWEVSLNGGAYADIDGGIDASAGDTVSMRLKSTTGVRSVAVSCYGTHSSSKTTAAIEALWTLSGTPNGSTVTWTIPSGTGQAYGIKFVVNGGTENRTTIANWTKLGGIYVLNAQSRRPMFAGESTETGAWGWVERVNETSDDAGGGGSLATTSAAGTVNQLGAANTVCTSDGSSAGGVWATITNAMVNASAAIAVTKLAAGTANYVVKTNSGGTALEHGLIANANVDAAAAIAGTKIDPDFGSQNITTTGTSTAASYSTGGSPPTGVEVGLENAGQIAWSGASSGTATLELNASDELEYTSVTGHSSQLGVEGYSGGIARRNAIRATGSNATPFTVDVPTPTNTEGVVEFAIQMRATSGDHVMVVGGVAGYKNVSGTVTYFGSAGMTPYDSGAPADTWTIVPSASGANLRITFTGSAAVGALVATGTWRLHAGAVV